MRRPKEQCDLFGSATRDAVETAIGRSKEKAEKWGEESLQSADDDVQDLAREIFQATGCGFAMIYTPPTGIFARGHVAITWDSIARIRAANHQGSNRTGFFETLREAMRHVLEYERIFRAEGLDAADRFHVRARVQNEAAVAARLIEQRGTPMEDPHSKRKSRVGPR